jgi:cation transport regulator ChaB
MGILGPSFRADRLQEKQRPEANRPACISNVESAWLERQLQENRSFFPQFNCRSPSETLVRANHAHSYRDPRRYRARSRELDAHAVAQAAVSNPQPTKNLSHWRISEIAH